MKSIESTVKSTGDPRRQVGEIGERAVRNHVAAIGWEIVDHNVRWREGELDLIAIEGHDLVIAEVKTLVSRGAATPFSPFESIGRRKQNQVRLLARKWLSDDLRRGRSNPEQRFSGLRFDAFAVTLSPDYAVLEIEHLRDAF